MRHAHNVLCLSLGFHFIGVFSLQKFYFWMFLRRGRDRESQEGSGLRNRDRDGDKLNGLVFRIAVGKSGLQ